MGLGRRDVDRALLEAAEATGIGKDTGDRSDLLTDPASLLCNAQPILVPFLRSLAERVKDDANFLVRWIGGSLLDALVELVATVCEEESDG